MFKIFPRKKEKLSFQPIKRASILNSSFKFAVSHLRPVIQRLGEFPVDFLSESPRVLTRVETTPTNKDSLASYAFKTTGISSKGEIIDIWLLLDLNFHHRGQPN